ncbi:MAG: substrate-binding domain-containing protein [Clostridia bacterium]|nr:substrate-binding domain-containing protein [Clostridia bacterium]
MRKLSKMMVFILILALLVPIAIGCQPTEESSGGEEASTDTITIGVSLPTQREERWVRDKEAMEKWAETYGVDIKVQVADADQAQQAQQVENLLTQGIDVLILAPHNASASVELVRKAKEENVPVLSYDRLVTATDQLDYYISFDNEAVGRLQGQYFIDNVEKGNVMLFAGAPTDNNALLFFKGAMEKLQPKIDSGDYTVLGGEEFQQVATDNWVPANAQNRATNILTANPDAEIAGVLAPNDGTAGGIIEAFKASGVDLPIVTGQDSEIAAIKRIQIGEQSMTIFKDTRELAKSAIESSIKIASNEDVATNGVVDNGSIEVPSILLEPKVVTQDNFQALLVDSGYIQASDIE